MDKHVARVFNVMNKSHDIRKATLYLSPTRTIKITRRFHDKRSTRHTYLLTIGEPNFAEKRHITTLKAAKEKFPVRKIQLQHYPKAKA